MVPFEFPAKSRPVLTDLVVWSGRLLSLCPTLVPTAKSITMGPFFQNDHTSLKTPSGAAIMPVFFPTKEYLSN